MIYSSIFATSNTVLITYLLFWLNARVLNTHAIPLYRNKSTNLTFVSIKKLLYASSIRSHRDTSIDGEQRRDRKYVEEARVILEHVA